MTALSLGARSAAERPDKIPSAVTITMGMPPTGRNRRSSNFLTGGTMGCTSRSSDPVAATTRLAASATSFPPDPDHDETAIVLVDQAGGAVRDRARQVPR